MTQFARPTLNASVDDGITLSTKFNGALPALYTNHAGAAAPPAPEKGQVWIDTSQEAAGTPTHVSTINTGSVWRTLGTLNLTTGAYATAGNLPLSGGTMTGAIQAQDGTAALPGYSFSGSAAMGMYRRAAGQLGFSANTAESMWLGATTMNVLVGTVTMTGPSNQANLNIERAVATSGWGQINFRTGTSNRVTLQVSGAEGTANAGSNFNLILSDDAGAQIVSYLQINRATRNMGINGPAAVAATVAIRSNDNTVVDWTGLDVMNVSLAADASSSIVFRTGSGAPRAAIRGERPGSANTGDLGIWAATIPGALDKVATFRASGNLELTGVLDGASGGRLRSLQRLNNIALGWGSIGAIGSGLSYAIDGGSPAIIPYATNATGMSYAGGTGGPTGISLNGLAFSGDFFGIFVDAVSDERIKENIRDTEVDAAALIMSVPVRAFDIKGEVAAWQRSVGLSAEQREVMLSEAQPVPVPIGFVTQELQRRVPESVKTPPAGHTQPEGSPLPDDCQTYSPEALVPYLWRAVQQQQEMIAALTSRITTLEAPK